MRLALLATALVTFAAAAAAGVIVKAAAPADSADPNAAAEPFRRMKAGETAQCVQQEGCVAMTMRAYHELIMAAARKGAELACRRGTSI